LAWMPAFAHDMWIERDSQGFTLLYGHAHSGHGGTTLMEYKPEIVIRVDCFDVEGRKIDAEITRENPMRISAGCAAVYVLTSSGYWSKTTSGTKNLSKKEAQSPLRSWQSFESVKRIDEWSDALSRPLTGDFEITALENPLALKPGDKIHLLVTLEGAPAQGATATYDGEPRGVTGKDGLINLKIRHGGFQMIQAGITLPLESEEADEAVHTTSLNFEIGETQ
jgi:nickel transport protein